MRALKCKNCRRELPNKEFRTKDGCNWCDPEYYTIPLTWDYIYDILNSNGKDL